MSKVTSKYQVSIPKTLAEKLGVRVGDALAWEAAAGALRARLAHAPRAGAAALKEGEPVIARTRAAPAPRFGADAGMGAPA